MNVLCVCVWRSCVCSMLCCCICNYCMSLCERKSSWKNVVRYMYILCIVSKSSEILVIVWILLAAEIDSISSCSSLWFVCMRQVKFFNLNNSNTLHFSPTLFDKSWSHSFSLEIGVLEIKKSETNKWASQSLIVGKIDLILQLIG